MLVDMLPTVQFNDQTRLQAGEIGDVGLDWMLSAEAMPIQVSSAEMLPQMALCLRCIATKSAGEVQLGDAIFVFMVGHSWEGSPQPSAAPPARGSGDVGRRCRGKGERENSVDSQCKGKCKEFRQLPPRGKKLGTLANLIYLVGAEHRGGC